MADQIAFQQRKDHIRESSRHVVTAYFRDRATAAASTPTNVRYRLENLTTGEMIVDWTAASAASSVDITITPTQNALRDQCHREETMELSVAADYGLSTQYIESTTYTIENVRAVQ